MAVSGVRKPAPTRICYLPIELLNGSIGKSIVLCAGARHASPYTNYYGLNETVT